MKRAIVIGASSGIGRAVASLLVERGWRVAVTARRSEALDELRVMYGADRVTTLPMDVTKDDATKQLDILLRDFGAPDLFFYASINATKNASTSFLNPNQPRVKPVERSAAKIPAIM